MTFSSDIEKLTRLYQEEARQQQLNRRDRKILIQSTIAGGVAAVLGQLALMAVFNMSDGDTKKRPEPPTALQIQIQPLAR